MPAMHILVPSLADLYDPVAMPPDLRKAHQTLDKAVDAAYGRKNFASDAERVAFLFELYHQYTKLPAITPNLYEAGKGKVRKDDRGGLQMRLRFTKNIC